jgi:hypothetical protein
VITRSSKVKLIQSSRRCNRSSVPSALGASPLEPSLTETRSPAGNGGSGGSAGHNWGNRALTPGSQAVNRALTELSVLRSSRNLR